MYVVVGRTGGPVWADETPPSGTGLQSHPGGARDALAATDAAILESMSHRACEFCGNDSIKITKEHVFPTWLRELFKPGKIALSNYQTVLPETTQTRSFVKSGTDMGIEVREVCKACNDGWMSDLESAAKDVLTPMIVKSAITRPVSADDQKLIARWVVKTVMVHEFTSSEPPFFTFQERNAFKEGGELADLAVWLASYRTDDQDHMGFSHTGHLTQPAERDGQDAPIHWFHATLVIGRLACQLVFWRHPVGVVRLNWEPHPVPSEGVVTVWPASTMPIWWPPTVSFDEEVMTRFVFRWVGIAPRVVPT